MLRPLQDIFARFPDMFRPFHACDEEIKAYFHVLECFWFQVVVSVKLQAFLEVELVFGFTHLLFNANNIIIIHEVC